MSHTNHRRNHVKKRFHVGQTSPRFITGGGHYIVSDGSKYIGACGTIASENSRSVAKDKRGAKKYVRSRSRFHENALTKKLSKEIEND